MSPISSGDSPLLDVFDTEIKLLLLLLLLLLYVIYIFNLFFFNSLLSSIIIIVPKNVCILLSLLLSVYEQMRISIFFVFLLKFFKIFFSLKRVCNYIFNHDI